MGSSLYGREILIPVGSDNPLDGDEPYDTHTLRAAYNNALHRADTMCRVLCNFRNIPAIIGIPDEVYTIATAKNVPLTLRDDGSTCPIRVAIASFEIQGDFTFTINIHPSTGVYGQATSMLASYSISLGAADEENPVNANWTYGVIPSITANRLDALWSSVYSRITSASLGTVAMDEVLCDIVVTAVCTTDVEAYPSIHLSEFYGATP